MSRIFNLWAVKKLTERKRCKVEPSMSCIPLAGDFICRTCWEEETAQKQEDKKDVKKS